MEKNILIVEDNALIAEDMAVTKPALSAEVIKLAKTLSANVHV